MSSRRVNCVESLGILLGEPLMTSASAMVASAICILGSQCGTLECLILAAHTTGLLGTNMAVLAALTRLKVSTVR